MYNICLQKKLQVLNIMRYIILEIIHSICYSYVFKGLEVKSLKKI